MGANIFYALPLLCYTAGVVSLLLLYLKLGATVTGLGIEMYIGGSLALTGPAHNRVLDRNERKVLRVREEGVTWELGILQWS